MRAVVASMSFSFTLAPRSNNDLAVATSPCSAAFINHDSPRAFFSLGSSARAWRRMKPSASRAAIGPATYKYAGTGEDRDLDARIKPTTPAKKLRRRTLNRSQKNHLE